MRKNIVCFVLGFILSGTIESILLVTAFIAGAVTSWVGLSLWAVFHP